MHPILLHAFNPGSMTGDGNQTWLVLGRVPTLVDAGVGEPRHLDALEAALQGRRLEQVIVTHGHSDHASGVAAIARRMTGVRYLKMAWPERDGRWQVPWTAVHDGGAIDVGDTSIVAVHTPGHAPDHLCLWHEGTRTLFGGDLASEGTTVYVPPAPYGDLTAYLGSLERVLAMAPGRILPAHGPVVDDPEALLRRYLAHRRQREHEIIEALRHGDSEPDTIVCRLYKELKDELRSRALDTVTAHLEKLAREGTAACRNGEWRLVDR